jgi:uncharacterized protein (DUF169 family)
MDQTIRTTINYAEASAALKAALGLKTSPVAIKLATSRADIPDGMEKFEGTVRHCQMVSIARKEGRSFYSTVENHECMGGAWALGLRELTETLKTGHFYFKLGKFESTAMLYAPLEKATFSPHIVLIVAPPRVMLKLAQASLFKFGGRIHSEFSGIQSICSDTTAQTYLTGKPNFSLGCDGSRKFSGIEDDEMVMGFPIEMLSDMVEAVQVVTAAPGSKK